MSCGIIKVLLLTYRNKQNTMKSLSEYGIYKFQIVEQLEAITKLSISNHILFTNRSTSKKPNLFTIEFFDYDNRKFYKATLKRGFLISNIREVKSSN